MIIHVVLFGALLLLAAGAGATAWRAIHRLTGGAWGHAIHATLRLESWLLVPGTAMVALTAWAAGASWVAIAAPTGFVLAALLTTRAPALSLILWIAASTALNPSHSTVQGMVYAVDTLGLSLAIALVARPPGDANPRYDLASLLLVWIVGWAYLAGVDYLTAWIADLPPELAWYLPRLHQPWVVLIVVASLAISIALVLLLSARLRRHVAILRVAAALICVGEACYLAWRWIP